MRVLLVVTAVSMFASISSFVGASLADDRIDRFMKNVLASVPIPGASVAVVKDGQIVKQASYGLASIEYDVKATPETPYLLASITKSITATAVLMLVEERKIDPDASIASYLDDAPAASKPITVRMLLGHTAGLTDRW